MTPPQAPVSTWQNIKNNLGWQVLKENLCKLYSWAFARGGLVFRADSSDAWPGLWSSSLQRPRPHPGCSELAHQRRGQGHEL